MDIDKLKALAGQCSVAGCEGSLYVKGLCSKHYQRMMKHGDPLSRKNLRQDPVDRFWPKVEKTDTCWVWKGFRSNYGYPRFYPGDGKRMGTVLAHRWIFTHVNGPIPNDMHVDHICRNRACVRPDHLRLLTPAENGLYAQQSCRWTAKSIADMRTLAAERVKSISVEKSALVELLDERDELITEVERLRADAARYRWLRDKARLEYNERIFVTNDGHKDYYAPNSICESELDDAIDAAKEPPCSS
jgi:hypothetical protein